MRIRIGILFLSFVLAGSLDAQIAIKANWASAGLKGKPSRIKEESVALVQRFGEWVEEQRKLLALTRYDQKGNLIESILFDEDGTISLMKSFSYDANSRLVLVSCFDSEGVLSEQTANAYDKNGNVLEEVTTDAEGRFMHRWVWENEYGAAGKLLSSTGRTTLPDRVRLGTIVAVDYTGMLADGSVFDSSEEPGATALEFRIGAGQMIPAFEQNLIGLKKGDKKTFTISAVDAYGVHDDEAMQEIPLSAFGDLALTQGMQLATSNPDTGKQMIVTVAEVKQHVAVVDFNHPLAGKDLTFVVTIQRVDPEGGAGAGGLVTVRNTFDEKGSRSERSSYLADGTLTERTTTKYDGKGNRVDEARYDTDGSPTNRQTWTYDDKGRLSVEAEYEESGKLVLQKNHRYTAGSSTMDEDVLTKDGKLLGRWTYIYDIIGNWKTKTQQRQVSKFGSTYFEPVDAVIRTIEYYP